MSVWATTLLIIVLLGCNAFFVAAEFALISSRRDRLETLVSQGRPAASTVLYAVEHLSIMLAAAQLGITICSLILGRAAEPAIAHFVEEPFLRLGVPPHLIHPLSFVIALLIITFLHILLGEMVPKNIAIAGPETLAMWVAPAIIGWMRITKPVVAFLNWLARVTLKAVGVEQQDELNATVDQQQLATMIAESRAVGFLDAEEHARLKKALGTEYRTVREVTIPLAKVHTLPYGFQGPTVQQLEDQVVGTGFSRFPVTGQGGALLGYVHIKDVLDKMATAEADAVISYSKLRPLMPIDADTPLDEALNQLHQRSAHMAQVRDRGSLIGIVTLEDVIEEFVGTVIDWTHEAGS